MNWVFEKENVLEVAKKMSELGLVLGSSGNVSSRIQGEDGYFAITPIGEKYDTLSINDIVIVDRNLNIVEGDKIPSSESLLHIAIYENRPDVGGIVHNHAVYSSVVAVTGKDIPVIIDEMVLTIGGPIKVSEYAPPASEELAFSVNRALGQCNSAIIGNHGSVSVGSDPKEALAVSLMTERVAKIFVLASIFGEIREIPEQIVKAEAAVFDMKKTSHK